MTKRYSRHEIWYGQRELLLIKAMRSTRVLRAGLMDDSIVDQDRLAAIAARLIRWTGIEDRLHRLLGSSSEVVI